MSIILVTIFVITFFSFASKRLKRTYIEIASLQSKNAISRIINNAVADNLKDYHLTPYKDENGFFYYDIGMLNEIVYSSNKEIVNILDNINHNDYSNVIETNGKYDTNGIIYEVPFSLITDNILFSSYGPLLPVKFNLLGEVLSKLEYKIEEFGVNNALISINMNVSFSFGIYLPLVYSKEDISVDIPIVMNVIEGKVPSLIGNYSLGE